MLWVRRRTRFSRNSAAILVLTSIIFSTNVPASALSLSAAEELALRTVASPIDGVVVDRLQDEGEYVNVDPVVRLATLDPLQIELLLPAQYFGKIRVGQQLLISAAACMRR